MEDWPVKMAELARCKKAAVKILSFSMSRVRRENETSAPEASANTLLITGGGGDRRSSAPRARSTTDIVALICQLIG
jgi:hypothetical protein